MRMPTVELPGLSRTGKRWARIRLLLLFGDVTVGRGIRNIARTCKEKAGRLVSQTSDESAPRMLAIDRSARWQMRSASVTRHQILRRARAWQGGGELHELKQHHYTGS